MIFIFSSALRGTAQNTYKNRPCLVKQSRWFIAPPPRLQRELRPSVLPARQNNSYTQYVYRQKRHCQKGSVMDYVVAGRLTSRCIASIGAHIHGHTNGGHNCLLLSRLWDATVVKRLCETEIVYLFRTKKSMSRNEKKRALSRCLL